MGEVILFILTCAIIIYFACVSVGDEIKHIREEKQREAEELAFFEQKRADRNSAVLARDQAIERAELIKTCESIYVGNWRRK